MTLYQPGTPQPIEVDGRNFTFAEFGDGTFQIESEDGQFWFNDSSGQTLVHGGDFPDSSGSKPLKIELELKDLSFRCLSDIAEAIIRNCLDGNYTVLGRGKRRR